MNYSVARYNFYDNATMNERAMDTTALLLYYTLVLSAILTNHQAVLTKIHYVNNIILTCSDMASVAYFESLLTRKKISTLYLFHYSGMNYSVAGYNFYDNATISERAMDTAVLLLYDTFLRIDNQQNFKIMKI